MTTAVGPPRPLVAGNWKMNGLTAALDEARLVAAGVNGGVADRIDVIVCPPTTLICAAAAALQGTNVRVGGQDCARAVSGAHTGDVAAEMIRDAGATAVIVGHSERRADHGETDALVRAKAEAAHRAGLVAIICIGETAGQRRAGLTLDVVRRQLATSVPAAATSANTAIAYEPVWAIGTGLTPTPADVADVHAALREALSARFGADASGVRLLYGGSVKASNAAELMAVANVNGALVGGASLKAADFLGIIKAYE